jgi:putative nucleotidyltransferase with HDIG domain
VVAPPVLTESQLALAVALFAMAVLGQLWPVHLSVKMKVTVEDPATLAAALLLSPLLAVLVAGGSRAVGLRYQGVRSRWYNRGFNVAVAVLSTGAASATYHALAGGGSPSITRPIPMLGAALAMFVVQTLLVDLVVALQLKRDPLANWWSVHRRDLPHMSALYALGALLAVSGEATPWAVVLFALPMLVVMLTLRESARIREQTRSALLELADLIDLRDPYTHGHSQRVALYAERLARRLRMAPSQAALVRDAARVHDIGKIGTNDLVLLKPGPLTRAEQSEMQKHADIGYRLLRKLPEFWEGAELVRSHHERHDGKGYPRGIAGDELALEVSVISVADSYDAMTTDRPYRKALSWDVARGELMRGRDSQWRGRVVDAFVEMIDEERGAASRVPLVAVRSV